MDNAGISYSDVIQHLEAYCKRQSGVNTYRGLEDSSEFESDLARQSGAGIEFFIDPMLPIDLVMVKTEQEPNPENEKEKIEVNYYTLYFVVSPTDTSAETERRLQFYRFYLNRICRSKAVHIVMVIPGETKGKLLQEFKRIADDNGFGLWKIVTSTEEPEEICSPKDFIQHMEDQLRNPPDGIQPFEPPIIEEAPQISFFFDRFVGEAVEALAGVDPKRIRKRSIERKLLDKVFELENISYANNLKKLVAQHLIEKGSDHDFVSHTFSTLWNQCSLGSYSDFLQVAEPPLYYIFASRERPYRDHYLHQFQVFLLGLYIIDRLTATSNPYLRSDIDKQWLIAASFHDIAYPLELYDTWARKFFDESLGIPEIGVSDIKSYFVDKSLMSSLGFLVNELCEKHFGEGVLQGNWLHKEQRLVRFLHGRITELKHHCLLSSMFLLKQSEQSKPEFLNSLFVPAALAITLHHYHDIWQSKGEKDEIYRGLPDNRKLKVLRFIDNPLAFILMFCDCTQEWGRPRTSLGQALVREEPARFILRECQVSDSQCLVQIKTPYLSTTDTEFRTKCDELANLEKFLVSPAEFKFRIQIFDKADQRRDYSMQGSGS